MPERLNQIVLQLLAPLPSPFVLVLSRGGREFCQSFGDSSRLKIAPISENPSWFDPGCAA